MVKIFSDSRVLMPEKEDTVPEDLEEALIEKGIDPSKLKKGIKIEPGSLSDLGNAVSRIFDSQGYELSDSKQRKVEAYFFDMQNKVYGPKKIGELFIASGGKVSAALIAGALPMNDEMVGMIKLEIYASDDELVNKIRTCFSEHSLTYIERDE